MTDVERLARFVVARSWDDLSDMARSELKIRVLDALGCALGARAAAPVAAIRAQLEDLAAGRSARWSGAARARPTEPHSTTVRSSATSTSTTRTSHPV